MRRNNKNNGKPPRGKARESTLFAGTALTVAGTGLCGVLVQDARLVPMPLWLSITVCVLLTAAGIALIVLSFVKPRPFDADELRQLANTPKGMDKEARRIRTLMFAAAGITAAWSILQIAAGGIRYGWSSAEFRDWCTSVTWGFVVAVIFLVGGLVGRTIHPLPRDDERETLIKLKAEAATSRIMAFICLAAEMLMLTASFAFEDMRLMYVGIGFLAAYIIHILVTLFAKRHYDNRM
ncbi:hypothetical protein [Bifidobacterium aesculapii]|uniref:hypothetical protein n=1 Tax=Bifidobacterium aesculapii TaxID=1329411 RepID=UPI0006E3A86E|nr:hypothetical protein [Bifidobacterium aesculapii]